MKGSGRRHPEEAKLSELMRRAQDGDAEAYRECLSVSRVLVTLYATRVLGRMGIRDTGYAEDMVQEVLLAVHAKRHTYDPSQLFTPWLFAIARYKLIDFGRRRKQEAGRQPLDGLDEALAAPVFSEPGVEDDLRKLVSTLPARQRELLGLVKLEGLSVAEAAARAGMSEGAVKVSVHRAMKSLKSLLGKERGE